MIKSFNRDEKKALVAIMKFIANTDGQVSDGEILKFNDVAEKKGFEDFNEIFREVDREVLSMKDIGKLIRNVRKKTHEYDILRLALEIAMAGPVVNPEETKILKMMGREWGIDIKSLLEDK